MAGNKKPRKPYKKPAYRINNPIVYRFSKNDDQKLKLVPNQAWVRMQEGKGGDEEYADVIVRLNYGLEMAKRYFTDGESVLQDSIKAMLAMRKVRDETGSWPLPDRQQLVDIQAGLEMTDEMQDNTTRRELRDAMRITLKPGVNV